MKWCVGRGAEERRILFDTLSPCHPITLSGRRGITFLELTVTLSVLAVAMSLVAEIGCWSLRARALGAARQEALEWAANVLEAARAGPWESLTPDWAAAQQLPESLVQRLSESRLTMRVEPVASGSQTKRVTVTIDWKLDNGQQARPVQLVGLFSSRSAEIAGGSP